MQWDYFVLVKHAFSVLLKTIGGLATIIVRSLIKKAMFVGKRSVLRREKRNASPAAKKIVDDKEDKATRARHLKSSKENAEKFVKIVFYWRSICIY